jgi:hypothetical protein
MGDFFECMLLLGILIAIIDCWSELKKMNKRFDDAEKRIKIQDEADRIREAAWRVKEAAARYRQR